MEEPYDLPEGWVWTRLGNIVSFEYGKGLRKDKRDSEGNIPVYGSNGIVGYHSIPLVEESSLIVGRKGSVGQVHISKGPCWPIDTTYYVIPPKGIELFFLFYLLLDLNLDYYDKSTAIPGLNRKDAYALVIPLPPLNEQHHIVTKLEALLAQLNKSKEHLAQVPQLIKNFRQSVLAAACSGGLTEQWRKEHSDVEPASELLKGIQEERIRRYEEERHKVKVEGRKKLKKSKNLELQEVNTEGLPELPEKWGWTKIGNLTDLTSGNAFKKREYTEKGIRLLQIANVHFGKIIWDNIAYLSSDYLKKYPNLVLKTGDILMALNRPILNGKLKIGVLEDRDVPAILYQRVGRFDFYNNLVKSYFFFYLQSKLFISRLINSLRGIDQPFVNKPKLLNLPFPLPPLPEQHAIVARVEKFFHFADTIEQRYQKAKVHTDRITQSLLAKAFHGELVPQDPNDEPASVLSERIKKEKEKLEKEKKARKRKSRTLLEYIGVRE